MLNTKIDYNCKVAPIGTNYMAKSITLRKIPPEVFRIILIEQHKEKIQKNKGVFGIEQTIYKIIRDYVRCKMAEEQK